MRTSKYRKKSRRYALLHEQPNGTIIAMVDAPMSMAWSKSRVCLWYEPPTHYYKKGKRNFIVRIGSKNCPIKVTKGRGRNNEFIMRSTLG